MKMKKYFLSVLAVSLIGLGANAVTSHAKTTGSEELPPIHMELPPIHMAKQVSELPPIHMELQPIHMG
jgi:hypothetical protein